MTSAKRDEAGGSGETKSAAGPAAGGRRRGPAPAKTPVPGWLIAVAVGITVVVTAWIITKKNPGIWESETTAAPLRIVNATSPAIAINDQLQLVAGARPVPPIQAGAANPHGDLGPCASCHTVLGSTGIPVPALHAYSAMPHAYPGGLCSDCHATLPRAATATGSAGMAVAAARGAAAPKITEAEWMGMEVAPLTAITREQYGIPSGINGVVATEVEGRALDAKLQAGDVIISVDSTPINDPAGFAAATGNGLVDHGTLQVFRGGKVLQAVFQNPAIAAPPPAQVPAAGGGDIAAQPIHVPTPQFPQGAMTAPPASAMAQQPPALQPLQPFQPIPLQPRPEGIAAAPPMFVQPAVTPPTPAAPTARPEAEAGRRQF